MKIQVTVNSNWGRDKFYPACSISEIFCELLGQKCFSLKQLVAIKKLGYSIEEVTPRRKF